MATRKASVAKPGAPNPQRAVRQTNVKLSILSAQQAEYQELVARIDRRLDELSARADRFSAKADR